ncbi:hypothetical protein [Actinomadura sp. NBRC 104412]|uniref:hypothetical protein n=1 Tax=Actinomadura sp. NBRC 104412 TaxID=3032203 RepID=UPI002555B8A0|nr:hypothetical protein [Actinomadura sp. NBRC 104412]
MYRRVSILAALTLAAVPLLGACRGNSYSCSGGVCHVTVNGAGQTLELKDNYITVTRISGDAMTVRMGTSGTVTIAEGQSSQVGPVTIKVTSVNGDEVKFDLT